MEISLTKAGTRNLWKLTWVSPGIAKYLRRLKMDKCPRKLHLVGGGSS